MNTLGWRLSRKDRGSFSCPATPAPPGDVLENAAEYFSNRFPISPRCDWSREEIERRLHSYFWHYPFQFGDIFVDADQIHFRGLEGRHYQRYFHFFPAILSRCGGSLAGKRVLEIGCNAGFWSIQARLAGAESVLGIDLSPKNVEQAELILEITGLDRIEYRVLNAYEVSEASLGRYDIVFFLGMLYHVDKPIEALERLYEVTGEFAVIDTTLARSDVPDGAPVLLLREDAVHDQNFSNRVALVPSKSAVPMMLRHVGFREVFWVPNSSSNLPLDYVTQARMSFLAVR